MKKFVVKFSYACCYNYKTIEAETAKDAFNKFRSECNYKVWSVKACKD